MDSFKTIYVFTVGIFLGSGNHVLISAFFYHGKFLQAFLPTMNTVWGMSNNTHMFFTFENHTFVKNWYFPHIAITSLKKEAQ